MSSEGGCVHSVAPTSAIHSSMSARRIIRASRIGGGEEVYGTGPALTGRKTTTSNSGGSSVQSARGVRVVDLKDEKVEERRAWLLAQKRTELDHILDKHDDLIREKFHMDNWKSMLAYDPQLVKSDESEVFRDFKMEFDLLRVVEPPVVGPSRQTRGAVIQRKKMAVAAISSVSAPSALLKISKPINKLPPTQVRRTASVSVRSDRKGKEKEVVSIVEEEVQDNRDLDVGLRQHAALPRKHLHRNIASLSAHRIGTSALLIEEHEEDSSSGPRRPNGLKRTRVAVAGAEGPKSDSQPMAKKKKKKEDESKFLHAPPLLGSKAPCGISEQESMSMGRTLEQRPANNPSIDTSNGRMSFPVVPLLQEVTPFAAPPSQVLFRPPETPSHTIKRIRLIVRKPMPIYTNPWQRPQLPQYKNSLTRLVSSYTALNRQHPSYENLQNKAEEEAAIRQREASFRQEGRFIPGTDVFFGTKIDPDELPPPYQPPKRETRDIWDSVIDSVVAHRKARAPKKLSHGKQVAGQVAARVQAYWDAQGVKKDKARVQEEKRLRGLAKSTLKMVVNEWKRAVHHIREQERLKEEEEERRRGHEHLDAILDQSGQLLFTQQSELKRRELGSSRASSAVRFAGWGNDSDDETDDGLDGSEDGLATSTMDDGDEGHPSEDDDDDDDNDGEDGDNELAADSTMLLMDQTPQDASPSPEYTTEPPGPSRPSFEDADDGSEFLGTSPLPYQEDDEDSDVELDHLIIPDPESSPVRPMRDSLKHLDYPSSSSVRSPSAATQKPDFTSEQSRPIEVSDEAIPILQPNNLPIVSTPQLEDDMNAEDEVESPPTDDEVEIDDQDEQIPEYLKPYAVAPVEWVPSKTITPPLLLRGVLRPYQQSGLEWLASLHTNNLNGILADEMGLGKTIQTIALLAHLACDRGIWGPHLIVVPTSVLLNWEMEFKKFLPGFKVLSYHGSTKRRKELRQGWMDKHRFNVCITSYALASKDQHIFKRKQWYYMVLDEAHMIKNFRSQRWNTLLMFRSFRRLLLTGTPLQNNLTELWALLQFLMSGSSFVNLKEFSDWFSNPLEKAIEMGNAYGEETLQRVSKLHTVLRPYLLRRLKRDVEKELPRKYEHLVICPLSKRQRFLYDEFMSRAQTTQDLQSGVYQKIANILMQLRKVCNHPDLFEVRPIVTSFAMQRSAIADFEIKELMICRRWLEDQEDIVNLDVIGLQFVHREGTSETAANKTMDFEATSKLPFFNAVQEDPPPMDTRTIAGFRLYAEYLKHTREVARWSHICYLNRFRCSGAPIYSCERIAKASQFYTPLLPLSNMATRHQHLDIPYCINAAVKSYEDRETEMAGCIDRFAFATPAAVALDVPLIAFPNQTEILSSQPNNFDQVLHRASVKLQIAFPDPSLLQYDCGKLQKLSELLREKKLGGHRVLIFTQMTKILDILEMFLSFHGYLYLRLDGATKIEDRQYITERFNADPRIFCFISSSRSGGVGINLTGADTVVFYDSDFNPQMDRQCEDRAHRIGQIRDVHTYRFVSQHTVEEAMLRKANQKRSLDDLVIQRGEFDWSSLFKDESALAKALGEYDDAEDARAAALAAKEEFVLEGADEVDFGDDAGGDGVVGAVTVDSVEKGGMQTPGDVGAPDALAGEEDEDGGTTIDYMVSFVQRDYDFFREWRL